MQQRNTKQKLAILETLRGVKSHPTAQELYDLMKDEYPKLSLGTVYRNLNQLADLGQILRLDFNDDSVHFDGDTSMHLHFYCKECHQIYDVSVDQDVVNVARVLRGAIEKYGHQIDMSNAMYQGVCSSCIRKNIN